MDTIRSQVKRNIGFIHPCAIVLIGHLNKKESSKDLYRSLGSIDIIAAARSVLQISASDEDSGVMVMHHVKSSLAPKGRDIFFAIDDKRRIQWIDHESIDAPEEYTPPPKMSKQAQAAATLRVMLESEPMKATEVQAMFSRADISERTLLAVKKEMGIRSIKKDGVWYWQLPGDKALREDI